MFRERHKNGNIFPRSIAGSPHNDDEPTHPLPIAEAIPTTMRPLIGVGGDEGGVVMGEPVVGRTHEATTAMPPPEPVLLGVPRHVESFRQPYRTIGRGALWDETLITRQDTTLEVPHDENREPQRIQIPTPSAAHSRLGREIREALMRPSGDIVEGMLKDDRNKGGRYIPSNGFRKEVLEALMNDEARLLQHQRDCGGGVRGSRENHRSSAIATDTHSAAEGYCMLKVLVLCMIWSCVLLPMLAFGVLAFVFGHQIHTETTRCCMPRSCHINRNVWREPSADAQGRCVLPVVVTDRMNCTQTFNENEELHTNAFRALSPPRSNTEHRSGRVHHLADAYLCRNVHV